MESAELCAEEVAPIITDLLAVDLETMTALLEVYGERELEKEAWSQRSLSRGVPVQ